MSFVGESKVKLLTMRVTYAGLARCLLLTDQQALRHEPICQGGLQQLTALEGIHLTVHQPILGWKKGKIKLYRDFVFHSLKVFIEKAENCKVSFRFVDHFFSVLPFFL